MQLPIARSKFIHCLTAGLLLSALPLLGHSREEVSNLLHIGEGGIVLADQGEEGRNWRTYSINLVDGTNEYGWSSAASIRLPHTLEFELAQLSRISRITLDSTVESVVGYDGRRGDAPAGAPLRRFRLLGADGSSGSAFTVLLEGELARSSRVDFQLRAPATVRKLKLEVQSNWGSSPQTYLSEVEAIGVPVAAGSPAPADVDGIYAHEYGPIVLRRSGNEVTGCYINGVGRLHGIIDGRVIRLAYLETEAHRLGSVVFVAAHDRLYGFWYGALNKMGSPWNAPKKGGLDSDLGGCAYLTAKT